MKTITVIFFLVLSLCSAGQEGLVITGKVTDKTTGEPIPYATIVFIAKVSVGTTSDITGNYRLRIPDISIGERLQISCIGYNDTAIPVARLTSELDFSLDPKVYSAPEVTVRPSRSTPFSIGPWSNTIALDRTGEPLVYIFSHHGINFGVYINPSRQQVGSLITSIDYFIANRGPVDAPSFS
ncbi:MAG: carboxypeptidase-like regulatory domain-containing protein [Bacteroidales bacterium]